MQSRAAFLITIDTEGDNVWSCPREVTTRNSHYLPAFQELCDRFGLRPTYLVNCEMAKCPDFRAFARTVIRDSAAEIGTHIHAWDSPPDYPLTDDDLRRHPCLPDYPPEIVWAKVRAQTELLEETFGLKMTSHRAGRWGFNGEYAQALIHHGYVVDCSVTPGIPWRQCGGKAAGSDYTKAPGFPYFVDLEDICRPGASALLEAPMTIMSLWPRADRIREKLAERSLLRRALNRAMPPRTWLRPNGKNLSSLLRLLRAAEAQGRPYVQFMLHSLELMPGGSPTFPTEDAVQTLYAHLKSLFSAVASAFEPLTLTEFAQRHAASMPPDRPAKPESKASSGR